MTPTRGHTDIIRGPGPGGAAADPTSPTYPPGAPDATAFAGRRGLAGSCKTDFVPSPIGTVP